jgi:excisionase family DNA binding protein
VRYTVVVRRLQTAERHVRAADEASALQKVQAELDKPYGFFGRWETIDTELDIVAAENPLPGNPSQLPDSPASLLLTVKAAAAQLGVSTGSMYELINSGEIAHVSIGKRHYVTHDHLAEFISTHSRTGLEH